MKKYVCIKCDFYTLIEENENQSNIHICPQCTQIMRHEIEIEHIPTKEFIHIYKNNQSE